MRYFGILLVFILVGCGGFGSAGVGPDSDSSVVDSSARFIDSLVAPYQKVDNEEHDLFLGVEMNYTLEDFGKILRGLGFYPCRDDNSRFYGKYCGFDAYLDVLTSFLNGSVNTAIISIPAYEMSENDIQSVYKYFVSSVLEEDRDWDVKYDHKEGDSDYEVFVEDKHYRSHCKFITWRDDNKTIYIYYTDSTNLAKDVKYSNYRWNQ